MRTLKHFFLSFGFLSLLSCVTVNIYFPEAAAEEALRGVARDILDTAPSGSGPAGEPQAALSVPVVAVLNFLIPVAQAADEPDVNVNTPLATQLRKDLKIIQRELSPYYASGAIGLSTDGLPVPKDLSQVPIKERTKLKQLLSNDGQKRKALFSEIARANGHPEWEVNLRDTFNRVFVEEMPSGFQYQDENGAWKQK